MTSVIATCAYSDDGLRGLGGRNPRCPKKSIRCVGVGGAVSVWGFFAFVTLLQSIRSRLLVIDRLTGRITAPRAELSFESGEGLALLAYSHLEKGRRYGFNFGSNRAVQGDTWVTEVGLITSEENIGCDAERYTPLWQRRVGRWLTWVAPNSTPDGVAQQLRQCTCGPHRKYVLA